MAETIDVGAGVETSIDKYGVTYWARVKSFNAGALKPLQVGRIYRDREIEIDCYITERVRELYVAGKLVVGDFVLVQFIEGDPDKSVAIEKAYKTW